MRRWLVGTGVAAVGLGVGALAFRLATPEIVVANVSGRTIDQVVVELPSSRVVFGPIQAGTDSGIYHSASQADGVYRYTVRFADASSTTGSCGYLTNGDFGKRLQLVVGVGQTIECRESNKIF